VLQLGRMVPRKGVETVIRALANASAAARPARHRAAAAQSGQA